MKVIDLHEADLGRCVHDAQLRDRIAERKGQPTAAPQVKKPRRRKRIK